MIIVGLFIFCFGLPFTLVPFMMLSDGVFDLDYLGFSIFLLAFSAPFFLGGIGMNYMGLRMISKAIITSEDSILNNDTVPISTLDEWEGMNMDVEVGLIWSHEDYLMRKDREWANAIPGWELTGQWRTTVPGKMSVVGYKKIIEESLDTLPDLPTYEHSESEPEEKVNWWEESSD
jgi:hypothetical protein